MCRQATEGDSRRPNRRRPVWGGFGLAGSFVVIATHALARLFVIGVFVVSSRSLSLLWFYCL